ncbi:hypothetical protein OUZ56_018687 [Daphnia magna]|uniref:Uncharacterized protein n=1 Tax=Daphnia magna TaxID=35525 RepID=A0ABQ9Z9G4_9CRUS|nr:hypothetical protein OUZ56_018687 [Daphnia magna]
MSFGQYRSNFDFSSAYRAADSPISCFLALTSWNHSSKNASANARDQVSHSFSTSPFGLHRAAAPLRAAFAMSNLTSSFHAPARASAFTA